MAGEVAFDDKAIVVYDQLVNQQGRSELAPKSVRAYMNKAYAVSDLGDRRREVALYEQPIRIWERLANEEDHQELFEDLARCRVQLGNALIALGERKRGLSEMPSVRTILEAEIAQTGCTGLKRFIVVLQKKSQSMIAERFSGS